MAKSNNPEKEEIKIKQTTIERIGGYLHRVVPIADKSGEIISYALKPLMVEFKPRDIIQVVVGSALLAVPVAMSEEAWNLGAQLHTENIGILAFVSILFISIFVYFNFYRNAFKGHVLSFIKRVFGTYIISLVVVALVLTVIEKCPWETDYILALKRIILVTFPATMGGTLSDTIK